MVNVQVVCILLECILVIFDFETGNISIFAIVLVISNISGIKQGVFGTAAFEFFAVSTKITYLTFLPLLQMYGPMSQYEVMLKSCHKLKI